MARPVLDAEHAEGPGQRVAAVLVGIDVERGEARPLGQELAAGDAVADRRVVPLQEGDGRGDGGEVALEVLGKAVQRRAALALRNGLDALVDGAQAGQRKQFEHQPERDVVLHRHDAARAQEAGQVGGRRVGRVELRHRWDERQDARRVHRTQGWRASFCRIAGRAAWAARSPSRIASLRAVKSQDLT